MARSVESQGHDEGGKRLVPSFHTCLPNSIWARLYPPGSRLAHPDGFGPKDFHGEAWPRLAWARRTPLREGARAQVEGPFLAGDGAPTLLWAPAQAAPRGVLSQREKASLRGAVRAYVHTRAPGPLPAPGAALRLEEVGVARLQRRRLHVGGGWRLERDALTAGPQRIWGCFLGTRDSLL